MQKTPLAIGWLGFALIAGFASTVHARIYPQTVNADTYGEFQYNATDATSALQEAINSRAERVIVPNTGQPWNVAPIFLHSDQEILFEDDVTIQALDGAYGSDKDQLFEASSVNNLTLRGGYGGPEGGSATFDMNKASLPISPQDEGRHAINVFGSSNVTIEGLNLNESGGDGIFIGGRRPSENITINRVVADNNYRQGVSITNARNVLIDNSQFNNTGVSGGANPPGAGLDIEPDAQSRGFPNHAIQDITVRNTSFAGNEGYGIMVFNKTLGKANPEVSINFENVQVTGPDGIWVNSHGGDSPEGTISFKDVTVTGTDSPGLHITANSASTTELTFENLTLDNVANGAYDPLTEGGATKDAHHPIRLDNSWVGGTPRNQTDDFGNLTFINTQILDDEDRAALGVEDGDISAEGLFELHGEIYVAFEGLDAEARADYAGAPLTNVDLEFINGTAPAPSTPGFINDAAPVPSNPEPTSLALLGVGGMFTLMGRKRRGAAGRN